MKGGRRIEGIVERKFWINIKKSFFIGSSINNTIAADSNIHRKERTPPTPPPNLPRTQGTRGYSRQRDPSENEHPSLEKPVEAQAAAGEMLDGNLAAKERI